MSARHEEYISPFSARYTSPEMSFLFSAQYRITTFRKLWVALAKSQKKLGLPITKQQIDQLEAHVEDVDFDKADEYEKRFRHDVMAHIHAYGDQCPDARSIIHLGATSSYVTDNGDLIQMREAFRLLFNKLIHVIRLLSAFAEKEASTPTLSYTHFQPAQPTTVGKRACLWLQDLLFDAMEWERFITYFLFLGVKGATGTQASFLALFDGDEEKVKQLEDGIAQEFGFSKVFPISGQTYTRKTDLNSLNALESFSASVHKMATDIRLLAHLGELTEGFGEKQVGSSAMPYKRNPIHSERICGMARFVMSLAQNPAYTTATQWLERSLDDSSNRRLSIPEAFLGADSILNLLAHLIANLEVHSDIALSNLNEQLPSLAMESILMLAAKKGKSRQEVHEKLRQIASHPHSLDQLLAIVEKELHLKPNEVKPLLTPSALIGRAPSQVHEFLQSEVYPFLAKHKNTSVNIPAIEI